MHVASSMLKLTFTVAREIHGWCIQGYIHQEVGTLLVRRLDGFWLGDSPIVVCWICVRDTTELLIGIWICLRCNQCLYSGALSTYYTGGGNFGCQLYMETARYICMLFHLLTLTFWPWMLSLFVTMCHHWVMPKQYARVTGVIQNEYFLNAKEI